MEIESIIAAATLLVVGSYWVYRRLYPKLDNDVKIYQPSENCLEIYYSMNGNVQRLSIIRIPQSGELGFGSCINGERLYIPVHTPLGALKKFLALRSNRCHRAKFLYRLFSNKRSKRYSILHYHKHLSRLLVLLNVRRNVLNFIK